LHTPWVPIVILGVVLVVVLFSMLMRKKGIVRTLVSLVIIMGLFIIVGIKILNPGKLIVNNDGIFINSRGETAIYWSDIDRAVVIECDNDTFLLAPADFKSFVSVVGSHISLE
jgi:hypothetical protein